MVPESRAGISLLGADSGLDSIVYLRPQATTLAECFCQRLVECVACGSAMFDEPSPDARISQSISDNSLHSISK